MLPPMICTALQPPPPPKADEFQRCVKEMKTWLANSANPPTNITISVFNAGHCYSTIVAFQAPLKYYQQMCQFYVGVRGGQLGTSTQSCTQHSMRISPYPPFEQGVMSSTHLKTLLLLPMEHSPSSNHVRHAYLSMSCNSTQVISVSNSLPHVF